MGSPEKISDRDSFTFVRRNDHGFLSKLRQPAERGGTVLHELRRGHCRSCAAVCAACRRCARTAQSRTAQSHAADAARGFGSAAPASAGTVSDDDAPVSAGSAWRSTGRSAGAEGRDQGDVLYDAGPPEPQALSPARSRARHSLIDSVLGDGGAWQRPALRCCISCRC